jgi:hypothetical protein
MAREQVLDEGGRLVPIPGLAHGLAPIRSEGQRDPERVAGSVGGRFDGHVVSVRGDRSGARHGGRTLDGPETRRLPHV